MRDRAVTARAYYRSPTAFGESASRRLRSPYRNESRVPSVWRHRYVCPIGVCLSVGTTRCRMTHTHTHTRGLRETRCGPNGIGRIDLGKALSGAACNHMLSFAEIMGTCDLCTIDVGGIGVCRMRCRHVHAELGWGMFARGPTRRIRHATNRALEFHGSKRGRCGRHGSPALRPRNLACLSVCLSVMRGQAKHNSRFPPWPKASVPLRLSRMLLGSGGFPTQSPPSDGHGFHRHPCFADPFGSGRFEGRTNKNHHHRSSRFVTHRPPHRIRISAGTSSTS